MRKDTFFKKMNELGLALTYGDVLLASGHSTVPPSEVSLDTRFSRNVPLGIPVVSAAMNTVTEWRMAIAMAMLGGIGVIHRSLSPEEQASQVKRVKFYLNGLIDKPVTARQDQTIEDILQHRAHKGWSFHSFPVVNSRGKLVGLLTKNDFDFCDDPQQVASKVMTTNVITAPPKTSLTQAYKIMTKDRKKLLPLVDRQGLLTGVYIFSDVLRIRNETSVAHNVDSNHRLRVAAAVGTGDEALRRVGLMHKRLDVVVIDTAHGDSKLVYETLRAVKRSYPKLDVVVGNVSEGASAKRLVDAGADGIKVGQGPGSICTTRVVAGIGRAQVSAVHDCVQAIRGSGVPVCADGGITYSGDITKAIGAGAHTVMLGRILASAEEAPGEIIIHQGQRKRSYDGMGSRKNMELSRASRERYRQDTSSTDKVVPEGVASLVPLQGSTAAIVQEHLGGLRSGMGYVGAGTIEELRSKARFSRITAAGVTESHPHTVTIISEGA